MNRIQLGETDRVVVDAVDATGAGVTGATVLLSIRRASDGYYWDATSKVFTSAFSTVTMTQTDSTNLPGCYHYDFKPTTTDFKAHYHATTATAGVVNDPWDEDVIVGYWVDDLDAAVTSRGSSSDLQETLRRLGATIVENDFQKIYSLLSKMLLEIQSRNL